MSSRLDELRSWLADLQREQEELAAALEPLLRRRDELRQKLELVQRLLSLEAEQQTGPHRANGRSDPVAGLPNPDGGVGGIGAEIQDAVRQILSQNGKPMHVSQIRGALVERGIPIPGKGTDANIIVHLRRAPTIFERKTRGTYGLAEWSSKAATRRTR